VCVCGVCMCVCGVCMCVWCVYVCVCVCVCVCGVCVWGVCARACVVYVVVRARAFVCVSFFLTECDNRIPLNGLQLSFALVIPPEFVET